MRRLVRQFMFAGCAMALTTGALAQGSPITAVGIFSLLGDKVQITMATEPRAGSHIESADRQDLDFQGIAFDGIVLKVAKEALEKAAPKAPVSLYKVTTLTPEQQRELAVGANGGALPAWMVQAIESKRLSHILIVTRDRGDASFKLDTPSFVGRGAIEGIGFYIDTLYSVRNLETQEIQPGLLVPYAEFNVQLMDVSSARVVANHRVHDANVLTADKDAGRNNDPWNFVTPQIKIQVLRDMVEKGVERAVTEVLKGR